MTPEEWQRVRPILESALELDPASETRNRHEESAHSNSSVNRALDHAITYGRAVQHALRREPADS